MSFSCDQAGARINAGADTVVAVTKEVTAAVEAVVVAATEVTYCLFRTFDNSIFRWPRFWLRWRKR